MGFAENIKLLRKRKRISQEELAGTLNIKRSSLSGYENGSSEPNFTNLIKFSEYFGVAIDSLLKTQLSILRESELDQLQKGYNIDISGARLRILATTIGEDNEENIELIPEKAKAGYSTGYADPEYLKILPTFRMPFLDKSKKYRTFQISGDSMPPIDEGSWVTGEYLMNWANVKNGTPCIIITKNDGIVFKIVYNKLKEKETLLLSSTNPLYEPYEVSVEDILEVWLFTNYITNKIPQPNVSKNEIDTTISNMKKELDEIKKKIS